MFRRCFNDYFTGLFHDLPEVLTRDIISPVKRSIAGLDKLIKSYEKEQMEKEVFSLIPGEWEAEVRMFTEDEFSSVIARDGKTVKTTSEDISASFNMDEYNPRDGEMIKVVDDLAAYVEAYCALENGVKSNDLQDARSSIGEKYKDKVVDSIRFGEIFREFS